MKKCKIPRRYLNWLFFEFCCEGCSKEQRKELAAYFRCRTTLEEHMIIIPAKYVSWLAMYFNTGSCLEEQRKELAEYFSAKVVSDLRHESYTFYKRATTTKQRDEALKLYNKIKK